MLALSTFPVMRNFTAADMQEVGVCPPPPVTAQITWVGVDGWTFPGWSGGSASNNAGVTSSEDLPSTALTLVLVPSGALAPGDLLLEADSGGGAYVPVTLVADGEVLRAGPTDMGGLTAGVQKTWNLRLTRQQNVAAQTIGVTWQLSVGSTTVSEATETWTVT